MKITCESTTLFLPKLVIIKIFVYDMRNFFYSSSFPHLRKIAPTILLNVPHDSLIMKEEIFGPLLPIITVRHALPVKIDLSLYNLFLDDKRFADNDSHTFMNYNNNMPSVISEVGSGEGSMTCLLYNLFLDNKRFANNDGHTFMNYNNNMSSVISQMGSGEDSVYATLLLTYEG